MQLPINEAENYAPKKGEDAAAYSARLEAMDALTKGFDHIAEALKGFASTKSLATAQDELMQAAIEGASAKLGVNVPKSLARSLIVGKAEDTLARSLTTALGAAWREIKQGSDLATPGVNIDQLDNKKVVKSFMDKNGSGKLVHNPLSTLVQEVLTLRDATRAASIGGK